MTARSSITTQEQLMAIDWTDPKEILAHGFTAMQMVAMHPRLHAKLEAAPAAKRRAIDLFLSSSACLEDNALRQEKILMLTQWITEGLFVTTSRRHCRSCQSEGHTKTNCPTSKTVKNEDSPSHDEGERLGSCKHKFLLHMQSLERQRLLSEKLKREDRRAPGNAAVSGLRQRHVRNVAAESQSADPNSGQFQPEDRRRGVVTRLDATKGIGFVSVSDYGEVRFFLDRTDYGVKEPAVNDVVTLKIDLGREIPTAVEVRPDKCSLTPQDVTSFLERCRFTTHPIKLIETILMQRHEWPFVVETIAAMPTRDGRVTAMNAIVALTTFVENREPIHLQLLTQFLNLLATEVPTTPSALESDVGKVTIVFYPTMLLEVLSDAPSSDQFDASESEQYAVKFLDDVSELSTLVLLQRQYGSVPEEVNAALVTPIQQVLTAIADAARKRIAAASDVEAVSSGKLVLRRANLALSKTVSDAAALQALRRSIFPSAAELSVPPHVETSAFHPGNLPKNVSTKWSSPQELIEAHCRLLRADTFESTCRVMGAACFQLPNPPAAETLQDVEHAKLLYRVKFVGRVPTRDRDFSVSNSYVFSCEPAPKSKASLKYHFLTGTCICITTGIDRTRIDPDEIFWGVVSSADSQLLDCGLIVVSPCEGSDFSLLTANLQRNAACNQDEKSMILETPLFLSGYRGVVAAMLSFVGPAAMQLPMANVIVGVPAGSPQSTPANNDTVGYIPPHARFAFDRLVEDVCQSFALDRGQEQCMRSLSSKELVLVQGPPGTGKSFIGARVVEVYIRYKQLMASGDILNTLDVAALSSVKWDRLTPKLGPVVVITYKNHALDEFLLDLMRTGVWNSERHRLVQTRNGGTRGDVFPRGRRIVRIGGRSREPELHDYNLNVLMNSRADKSAVNVFRDRVYLMNSRLERLAKEIQLLERGRIPKPIFDKWLTEDQRGSIRYEDREEWLAGANFVGRLTPDLVVNPNHFVSLLQSSISQALVQPLASRSSAEPSVKSEDIIDEDDIRLSVFKEMQREDESRETNDNLRHIYISAEAIALASSPPTVPEGIPQPLLSLWSLSPLKRHEYYAYLIRTTIAAKARDWMKVMEAMQNTLVLRNHAAEEARLDLLQGADVIGLTTTGCAMHQNLLRSLRPSLLVVEEAAEVLEAQLLACMTDSLKQVVLIGDHFQLKPKVETFLYEKVNKLNVSMFERLARQSKPIRLVEQRRMHPLISSLIRPFYNDQPIQDHASVLSRAFIDAAGSKHVEHIPGLGSTRLFMWDHNQPEEMAPNSLSKINRLELTMCVKLAEHLVDEGVLPKSITMITPYLGQCRALRNALRLRPSNQLRDIRVSTVDLFQGDENDIVILSMVRTQKLTDFLKMRNRMVVSCSRARYAFIIVGNSKLLDQSPHWKQVLDMLRAQRCIAEKIPLVFSGRTVAVGIEDWPRKGQQERCGAPTAFAKDEWLDNEGSTEEP